MTLMEAYRLTLRERVQIAKAVASSHPTTEHLTAYGRAILDHRASTSALPTQPMSLMTDELVALGSQDAGPVLGLLGTRLGTAMDRLLPTRVRSGMD